MQTAMGQGHAPCVHLARKSRLLTPPMPSRYALHLVRIGKELEFHIGSAAHALFGIRNMAIEASWHEYAIVGRNFVRAAARVILISVLLGGLYLHNPERWFTRTPPAPGATLNTPAMDFETLARSREGVSR